MYFDSSIINQLNEITYYMYFKLKCNEILLFQII
jgi:hypothetical protein